MRTRIPWSTTGSGRRVGVKGASRRCDESYASGSRSCVGPTGRWRR